MLTKKIRLFIYKIPWVYTFLAKSWRLINGGGWPVFRCNYRSEIFTN